jgi:hypothetical protein
MDRGIASHDSLWGLDYSHGPAGLQLSRPRPRFSLFLRRGLALAILVS